MLFSATIADRVAVVQPLPFWVLRNSRSPEGVVVETRSRDRVRHPDGADWFWTGLTEHLALLHGLAGR